MANFKQISWREIPEDYSFYKDMLGETHPIGYVGDVIRFKEINLDNELHLRYKNGELNNIWSDYLSDGQYTTEEMMQFYREIGYSLSGYIDVWGERWINQNHKEKCRKCIDIIKGTNSLSESIEIIKNVILELQFEHIDYEVNYDFMEEMHNLLSEKYGESKVNKTIYFFSQSVYVKKKLLIEKDFLV